MQFNVSAVSSKKGSLILAVIGVVFIALGLLMTFVFGNTDAEWVTTTATISDIQYSYHGDETDYDVFVDFTVDSTPYEGVHVGSYSSSWYEGKEITIQYDAANPNHIRTPMDKFLPYIFFAVGALLLGGGAYGFIKFKKRVETESDSRLNGGTHYDDF